MQGADCGPTVQVQGEFVVCAAWFDAVTRGGTTELTTTVQVDGDLQGRRVPTRLELSWVREDGCREGWLFTDSVAAGPQLELLRACRGEQTLQPLTAAQYRVGGDRMVVRLSGADLVAVGSDLAPGDRLTAPVAASRVVVRLGTGVSAEATTLGGSAGPGRDYVVPGPA